jgi:hypothetical protein
MKPEEEIIDEELMYDNNTILDDLSLHTCRCKPAFGWSD